MFGRLVAMGSVLGILAMLAGCASAPKPAPAPASAALEAAPRNMEAWSPPEEFEMSIGTAKERQVQRQEETALRPKLVTQQRSHP